MEIKGITTSAGETFTIEETEVLANLIAKRFGWDMANAAEAWRTMFKNSCTDDDFRLIAMLGQDRFVIY